MRYLQIEWHNHERARNAWDIERAEMKAKIAKQEGECRQAKRINEQLERQVRMLELALKNERNKSKAAMSTVATPDTAMADTEAKGNAEKKSWADKDQIASGQNLKRMWTIKCLRRGEAC